MLCAGVHSAGQQLLIAESGERGREEVWEWQAPCYDSISFQLLGQPLVLSPQQLRGNSMLIHNEHEHLWCHIYTRNKGFAGKEVN